MDRLSDGAHREFLVERIRCGLTAFPLRDRLEGILTFPFHRNARDTIFDRCFQGITLRISREARPDMGESAGGDHALLTAFKDIQEARNCLGTSENNDDVNELSKGAISYGSCSRIRALGVEFQPDDVLNFEVTFDGLHGPWEDTLVHFAQVRSEFIVQHCVVRAGTVVGISGTDAKVIRAANKSFNCL